MAFEEEIKKVLKEGSVALGIKRVKKNLLRGGVKLVIATSNAPQDLKDDARYYASLSDAKFYEYPGTSKDLGYVCAKPFPISFLAVLDDGGSKILDIVK